jgi:hypothetical protein
MKIELNNKTAMFTALRFCGCACMPKKDVKSYRLDLIKIDGNKIIGSDGCRLHVAEFPEKTPYDDGFYEIVKLTQKELILLSCESADIKYINPFMTDLWPNHADFFEVLYSDDADKIRWGLSQKGINVKNAHINDALIGQNTTVFFGAFNRAVETRAKINQITCKALIMPIVPPTIKYCTTAKPITD